MDFKEELKSYVEIVNNELEKYVKHEKCPEEMLNESMVFPFAVAMEMIHNFSLIHDDLPGIDNDDFRHGKPTNHKKFNESTAILAGDALLNNAYIVISNDILKEKDIALRENKIRAFNELTVAVDRMIAGEYVDTEFEGKEISNEYLEYMHNNKTGALIKASVKIGGILAGKSDEELKNLIQYAEKIGLAFQIKDDILSEIGDEKVIRKTCR